MKPIYCIEEWIDQSERVRDDSIIFDLWKIGKCPIVTEYESEEQFIEAIIEKIKAAGVISKVFIRNN